MAAVRRKEARPETLSNWSENVKKKKKKKKNKKKKKKKKKKKERKN